nr:MAG TPA: hypothetical protein [Caudoviricetes sp.]
MIKVAASILNFKVNSPCNTSTGAMLLIVILFFYS